MIISLGVAPVFAMTEEVTPFLTAEAHSVSFWQEADITFWQTLPFATLWGYFIDSLVFSGSQPHWVGIASFAAVVSAGNALIHARKVAGEEK